MASLVGRCVGQRTQKTLTVLSP
ncbi:MAG: hypothetical protein RIT20_1140, partial [Pseudomonadota bacterium]